MEQKKSDEINKRINNEHMYYEAKKIDEDNFHLNKLEAFLENQDFTFFVVHTKKVNARSFNAQIVSRIY